MLLTSPHDQVLDEDTGSAVYRLLIRGSAPDAADPFDIHVTACILSLAFWEAATEDRPMTETTGLDPVDLADIIETIFPQAVYLFPSFPETAPARSADEDCLVDLLSQCVTQGTPFQMRLARMVARRAQSPNHLWQDLGLRDRGELSRLMMGHFRPLAGRNTGDMKWKKFLYRMICRDAGYSICTAPSCRECGDFDICFGDESGESRLARVRRVTELGDAAATIAA